ncbi:hypothetical protein SH580_08980 [Coraliomargarita algicola]|uniref:PEP-CTERM sorting domain-containing protein n=1 Tax=Coraliomargarita algicola TaxID=3092156 RepID=A0ABZ0RRP4_9BACT|nr:hypothetical protein [Coraliomargarita sp. J2-16]WPJ97843.1 hypothetical protein SH580_08980 [Coraliomargarita sp. J2-16]
MKIKSLSTVAASLMLSVLSISAQSIYSDDFSSGGFSGYTVSSSANADRGAVIVDETTTTPTNPFSGNAAHIYDFKDGSAIRVQKDYTLTASTQLVQLIQFDAALATAADTTDGTLVFRVANAGTSISSQSNSAFELQLRQTGVLAIYGATNNGFSDEINVAGSSLSIYANSSSDTIVMSDLADNELTLQANEFAVYSNGSKLGVWGFFSNNFSSSDGIGSLGFVSNTATNGTNVIIDNISVTAIPEPSATTLLMGSSVLVFSLSRLGYKVNQN